MTEAWFDGPTAGLVGGGIGSLVGVWGAAVGGLAGWLVPRCRGRTLVFGLFAGGLVAGLLLAGTAGWALVDGQPYHVWYSFLLPGVLLSGFGLFGPAMIRARYRQAEEQRMARQNAV